MRSLSTLLLLSLLCVSTFAEPPGGPTGLFNPPTTGVSKASTTHSSTRTTITSTRTGNTDTHDAKTTSISSLTDPANAGGADGDETLTSVNGASVNTGTADITATAGAGIQTTATPTPTISQDQRTGGGLTSSAKIGVGVGVGIGVALVAAAAVLFFVLRRRRSNSRYSSSGVSASHLRDQPAMASGAPALAGMSEMGRSPSKHSLPRTPSQHSLVDMQDIPAEPKVMPPSQQSLTRIPSKGASIVPSRGPSVRSEAPSFPERESLMPTLPPYDDAPSPLQEHHHEPISPVSPISPMNSRPPSPLNDHER